MSPKRMSIVKAIFHDVQPTQLIKKIQVKGRFRKDLRDINKLVDNIAEIGLLQPIVIDQGNRLIAGGRRLAAVKLLGWKRVKVTVVDLENAVKGQYSENAFREPFLPSELVAISRKIRKIEAKKAHERQIKGVQAAPGEKGQTRDKVSKFLGISSKYLERAEYVIRVAEMYPKDLEIKEILRTLDKPKGVARAYVATKRFEQLKKIENSSGYNQPDFTFYHSDFRESAWKESSFDFLVCDPPWAKVSLYGDISRFASRALKPGKLLLCYSGPLFLPQVIANLSNHLKYVWQFIVQYSGKNLQCINGIFRRYASVLVFSNGDRTNRHGCYDSYDTCRISSKQFHKWEQDLGPIQYWIDRLTDPGDMIGDFFLGSGTTAVACKLIGNRKFVGCDVDPQCIKTTEYRLKEFKKEARCAID
jgi:ParB-like chromosome segregation protein Spo0J